MKNAVFKKIVSVLLIFFTLSYAVLPSFAQATPTPEQPTPIETLTTTPSPTPTPDSTQSNLNEQNAISNSSTDSATIIVSPEGIQATNSGDLATIDTSSSDSLTTTIDNTNNANIDRTVDANNTTGDNTLTDNIALQGGTNTIVTGNADTVQNITTVVNTNVVGISAAIVLKDVYDPNAGTIDLSSIAPCYAPGTIIAPQILSAQNTGNNVKIINSDSTDSTFVVRNNNNATIQNDINLNSNTGNNSAINNISSGTSVQTGDALTSLNLFTMANTNLVGNCYFYGVINLFGNQNGDIIFPYELDMLQNNLSPLIFKQSAPIFNSGDSSTLLGASNVTNETIIKNKNNADVNENVTSASNTGRNTMNDTINFNTIGSIVTGNATDSKNMIDMINTNYVANNFFFLLINRYGNWNGQVLGLDSTYLMIPQASDPNAPLLSTTAIVNSGDFLNLSNTQTNKNTVLVSNVNNLALDNNINLNSNTGDNEAGRFNTHIQTGNAQARANIFTMGNTNIIGDNWFFAVVNIFDDFVGNIIFPRPELVVSKMVDQASHNAGDVFSYTIAYGNFGNTYADNVIVADTLPSNLELVSASSNATISGNSVVWNIGKLNPGQNGAVSLLVRTNSTLQSADISNTATITNSRVEINYANNVSIVSVHIHCRVNCPDGAVTSTTQPSTTVLSPVVSPLGGSILPTGIATTHKSILGSVKGIHKTVAKGKTKTGLDSAPCGLKCQQKVLKSDQSILTMLSLLLVLLVSLRKRFVG